MLSQNKIKIKIPLGVKSILKALKEANFEAVLVGGCVRDILLGVEPKDWDVATNATPKEIQKIFPESIYENEFGTVGVKTTLKKEPKVVEVTTYRIESGYSDKRHPDIVEFTKDITQDLSRRDFTINAMALKEDREGVFEILDPFGGRNDLKNKIIRAVGDPLQRFREDALRMLRAVRFACQLDFEIEKNTYEAIGLQSALLEHISKERIRDEFQKIIMTPKGAWGIEVLYQLGLLKYILPELIEGIGVTQNKHHIYTVWEHNLKALEYAIGKNYSLEVRLASLLHDVGKPRTKKGDGPDSTFYQHEYVGAKMTRKALERLKFPKEVVDKVTHLVRYHLFYYNVGEVTEAGVRRFLKRVGPENVDDLIKVREADRIGSGVPKAFPYKLRHLLFMIEKVKRDPISPKMLKINGNELMTLLNIKPGPRVGHILNALLEEVIKDPSLNTKDNLKKMAKELNKLSDEQLALLRLEAEKKKEEFESGIEQEIKSKYKV
jgi:poly(A) polymerase/tRNA nucleotidyltransferase (CCA-adding enzyme)